MDIFLTVLALIAFFVLLGLPALVWHLRDRAIDGQLRRAERGERPEDAVRGPGVRRTAGGPAAVDPAGVHVVPATLRRKSITLRH
ncbi:hypothetical protein KQY30_11470 [Streptomyces sp. GMY02]|uniref:hypothetical protein n=1 Tax=Streptomyces sp. GMY02 TaxID=1333528 RepID=UPI001C2BC55A|nr:hypothetical protein [Streptomyces sp. GMY02]QXE34803.1 hypothetical protein KQY30_11470 [Streptomyces sp. GMY02]